jgi:hypothetical protein
MSTTGLCWLSYQEQMQLREILKAPNSNFHSRILELELDNEMLRAEIETLQRMRHASLKGESS